MAQYKFVPFKLSNMVRPDLEPRQWGIFLNGQETMPILVGLNNGHNFLRRTKDTWETEGTFPEFTLRTFPEVSLKTRLNLFVSVIHGKFYLITDEERKSAIESIKNIHEFSLNPRLSGPWDFESNSSFMLTAHLGLSVCHGWVVSPDVSIYDSVKGFTHDELEVYSRTLSDRESVTENVEVIQALLEDSHQQLTDYGFESLCMEIHEDSFSLLYRRNRLDIIHKHDGDLLLLVSDENDRERMPQATWMVFERFQQNNIYLTAEYEPVENQPNIIRATEWYQKKVEGNANTDGANADVTDGGSSEAANANKGDDTEDQKKKKKLQKNRAKKEKRRNKRMERNLKEEEEAAKADKGMDQGASSHPNADDAEGDVSEDKKKKNEEEEEEEEEEEANVDKEGGVKIASQDPHALVGIASKFYDFLTNFEDDKCFYFRSILESFKCSSSSRFYVPYEFIMAHSESMALDIQNNYSSVSANLKEAVEMYLKRNEVHYADVELKITGLPEPKSVQLFLDFINGIPLHEYYVYDKGLEALPSFEFRRMATGYLGCIITKFKTGRCWDGKWSEANMKVKNNSDFVIDYEDFELHPDGAFNDLFKFGSILINPLRYNGKLPPFCDDFFDDIRGISEYFSDSVKWERFLLLISAPLWLKSPLVRSSFFCNVSLGANGNCSGDPPRYAPLLNRKGCHDWTRAAINDPLLQKIYNYKNYKGRKLKYLVDKWSITHWHVFKFSRHFIQHILRHTKDKNLIQQIQDIAVIDILLARAIGRSIAQSVRFLVLDLGVDGLFSSAWRHYVGSEYIDKPHGDIEADGAQQTLVQDLVNATCDKKVVAQAHFEVEVPSERSISFVASEADLTQLSMLLNDIDIKCELIDGVLHCGDIKLMKREPNKNADKGHPVIVVDGPYGAEYHYIITYLLLGLA